jgi:hypothetical protein
MQGSFRDNEALVNGEELRRFATVLSPGRGAMRHVKPAHFAAARCGGQGARQHGVEAALNRKGAGKRKQGGARDSERGQTLYTD